MLGMFFETKYGKIFSICQYTKVQLGMFFETKYGKMQDAAGATQP